LFVAELPQKKRYFNTQKSTRFLSTGVEKKKEKKRRYKKFFLFKRKKRKRKQRTKDFSKNVFFSKNRKLDDKKDRITKKMNKKTE